MDSFLADAREIFEVAKARGNEGEADFAMLIGREGGLRVVMAAAPFTLEGLVAAEGSRAAYRVTRGRNGVRLEGWNGEQKCVLEERRPAVSKGMTPDEVLYSVISSPRMLEGCSCL